MTREELHATTVADAQPPARVVSVHERGTRRQTCLGDDPA
jgi:hypothetical protein